LAMARVATGERGGGGPAAGTEREERKNEAPLTLHRLSDEQMMVDLALVDLDPSAPHPRLGSIVTLRGPDVLTADNYLLGRLPPPTSDAPPPPASGATATVRSVRRTPEGGLAGVVVRLGVATAAAPTHQPADDTGVRPVARRRGERGGEGGLVGGAGRGEVEND